MFPQGGTRVCSICGQEAGEAVGEEEGEEEDGGEEEEEGEAGEQGGASDASDDEAGDDDLGSISSCGGRNLAAMECRCGGWRFNDGDRWLCVHCDHTVRVSDHVQTKGY